MNIASLKKSSVWFDKPRPQFAPLQNDAHFEVIVIGGGITGLTTAFLLKQAGINVGLFEKGQIGDSETGNTTAHLTYVTDARLTQLANNFGSDHAQLVWQGGKAAIDMIEQIAKRESIACGFERVPGYLHAPLNEPNPSTASLQEEAQAAQNLGFQAEFFETIPFGNVPGVRYLDQALFHPVAYLNGLAQSIETQACKIYCRSEMTQATNDPLQIEVNGHRVTCERLVVATHVPLTGIAGLISATLLQSKLAAYTTYAVGGTAPLGTLPAGSYNDTSDPYYYLRVHHDKEHSYVILGGEDHKTGQTDDENLHFHRLVEQLRKWMPTIELDHCWSGQVLETNDGLPFIGPLNDQQFVAAGYSGNGMTFGTLAAMMACDWALEKPNAYAELLDPKRTKIRGGTWNYIKENLDYPVQLAKSYLKSSGNNEMAEDLSLGEGRVFKIDGQHRAIYRDQRGHISNCSAVCPHLGCIVHWNQAEKTWDCPCHGSRFSPYGEVLTGPAESPLYKDKKPGTTSHERS